MFPASARNHGADDRRTEFRPADGWKAYLSPVISTIDVDDGAQTETGGADRVPQLGATANVQQHPPVKEWE